MILAIIFVVASVLALLLIFHLAKGHHATAGDLDQLASQLRSVDVNAFRNLVDEQEDEYLRQHLPPNEFRSIQRERKLAAIEYIRCAAKNAAILIRLAEAARENPDPAIAQAASKLFDNALQLRLYSFQIVPRLYLDVLFPGTTRLPADLADSYDTLARQVVMLGCLHYPTRGMSSAL
jgi:hypothetical protein